MLKCVVDRFIALLYIFMSLFMMLQVDSYFVTNKKINCLPALFNKNVKNNMIQIKRIINLSKNHVFCLIWHCTKHRFAFLTNTIVK